MNTIDSTCTCAVILNIVFTTVSYCLAVSSTIFMKWLNRLHKLIADLPLLYAVFQAKLRHSQT